MRNTSKTSKMDSTFGILSMSDQPLKKSEYQDKKIGETIKVSQENGSSPDSFVVILEEDYDFEMINQSKKNGSSKYVNEEQLKSILDDQGEESLEKLQIQYKRLKSIHENSDMSVSSLTLQIENEYDLVEDISESFDIKAQGNNQD